MRFAAVAIVCLALVVSVPAQSPPTTAPAEDALVLDSLLRSAANLYYSPDASARAARLAVIAEWVARLKSRDVRAQELLLDINYSQSRLAEATAAARAIHDAEPNCYAAALRWLRLKLAGMDRADERADFLKKLLDTPSLPTDFRSEAATELARLLAAQGAQGDALAVLKQALDLNPLNHAALISQLDLAEHAVPEYRLKILLALLKGNPRAISVLLEMGNLLGMVGLHEQALRMFQHAWTIAQNGRDLADAPDGFAAQYLSALLDAGQPAKGVELFEPLVQKHRQVGELDALLLEAYRDTEAKRSKTDLLLRKLETYYSGELTARKLAAEDKPAEAPIQAAAANAAIRAAWFYLLSKDDASAALKAAEDAQKFARDNIPLRDAAQLCLLGAQLRDGDGKALRQLLDLMETQPLAAACVATYFYKDRKFDQVRKAVLAGMNGPRKNLAYRRLAALAKKIDVPIPAVPEAEEIAKTFGAVDPHIFQIAAAPEQAVKIELTALPESPDPCQPILIQATLTNQGTEPFGVGDWGLVSDRLALVVTVEGQGGQTFTSLPLLTWPAPRQLAPREKVVGKVRVDVGPLAVYLMRHPLGEIDLRVEAIPSPVEVEKGYQTDLPTVVVQPLKIRRWGLIRQTSNTVLPTAQDYNRSVRDVETALGSRELAVRAQAARQVGSLIAWMRDCQTGAQRAPATIEGSLDEKVLLGLLGKALADSSVLVRSEAVASLQYADLNPPILNQLGAVIEDPSPLVRFRIAELLGLSRNQGNDRLLNLYATDTDKLVETMAKAFLEKD